MAIDGNERYRRKEIAAVVERLRETDVIRAVDSREEIREQAMACFAKHLDGKLKNLQEGEHLVVQFILDIVDPNGKVRGGSGAQRNMPEYIKWRSAVYERDGYKCQECGATDSLNAHHIKAWATHPELRFDIDNGVTLCFDCHAKIHPHIKFGRRSKS